MIYTAGRLLEAHQNNNLVDDPEANSSNRQPKSISLLLDGLTCTSCVVSRCLIYLSLPLRTIPIFFR